MKVLERSLEGRTMEVESRGGRCRSSQADRVQVERASGRTRMDVVDRRVGS